MKSILILLMAFLLQSQVIKMKTYYEGEGVIFDNSIIYPYEHDELLKTFNPSIEDVIEAENVFSKGYYEYRKAISNNFPDINFKVSERLKDPRVVIKKYYKYNRQYGGFITKANDTIIYLSVLNFSNPKQAEKDFKGWKNNYILNAENLDKQLSLEINISKNIISYNWDRKLTKH